MIWGDMEKSNVERYKKILTDHRQELERRYHVSSIGLFGSRLRGDYKENSDLGVLNGVGILFCWAIVGCLGKFWWSTGAFRQEQQEGEAELSRFYGCWHRSGPEAGTGKWRTTEKPTRIGCWGESLLLDNSDRMISCRDRQIKQLNNVPLARPEMAGWSWLKKQISAIRIQEPVIPSSAITRRKVLIQILAGSMKPSPCRP